MDFPEKMQSKLIRKGNRLIEARYRLGTHHQRILHGLLEIIDPTDEAFANYHLDISEMATRYGLESNKALYSQIEDALRDLVGNVLEIQEENSTLILAWLASARYEKGSGKATVSFHPDLKPYLLQLRKYYTEYPISAVINFKSSYSFRFYEWMQLERFKGKGDSFFKVMDIAEIRSLMQFDKNEYSNFKDLRVRVIETALQEIHKHSDLDIISVEYFKTGRSVTSLKITARPKPNILIDRDDRGEPKTEKSRPEAVEQLIKAGISPKTAGNWLKKYGSAQIMRNLQYANHELEKGKIEKFSAYLAKAIAGDYADGWHKIKVSENEARRIAIKAEEQQRALEAREKKELLAREANERKITQAFFIGLSRDTQLQVINEIRIRYPSVIFIRSELNEIEKGDFPREFHPAIIALIKKELEKMEILDMS